ncbi:MULTISPECIES: hypothetical protein [unclassified Pedobacter]|uniref:hypothetical protein n=1 Tax=unclassified Pedobacter TaxID=2628915 RepID=UPI00141E4A20|nr:MULTISPECIES: hypothetical protein [unclassified Pedobacter]NII81735.1 hypothetical protein [Pedobacter sp. SG908]NMN35739.1 hypothetical protein [Pedobacter sp. SG918]
MQVEHKTEKGEILFVDVPDGVNFYEFNGKFYFLESGQEVKIPQGFELIGLTSEVTEVDVKKILTYQEVISWCNLGVSIDCLGNEIHDNTYVNYLYAFKSLMQHLKLYEVNPYKQKPCEGCDDYEVFTEAQARTSKRVVLFKPN